MSVVMFDVWCIVCLYTKMKLTLMSCSKPMMLKDFTPKKSSLAPIIYKIVVV